MILVKKFPGFKALDKKDGINDVGILELEKCVEHSMEIDFSPIKSEQKVIVGGYGAIKLGGWTFQPSRRMGPNKIKRFDQNEICLGSTRIESDGVTIKDSPYCVPIGQDSGSKAFLNKTFSETASSQSGPTNNSVK